MSNELMVLQTDCAEVLEPEIVSEDKVFVAGRNWSSMNIRRGFVTEGRTIKEILCDALRREFDKTPTEFQEKLWLDRCRCKVNGVEIEAREWDSYIPKAGEFVEFLVAPKGGGGGGGKNVLNMVLMFAVIAVAIYVAGPLAAQAAGFMQGGAAGAALVELGGGTLLTKAVGSLAVAATMTVGTYAVNKICPVVVPPQQAQSSATSESSPTYSLNGSSNSANPYGYVPLVLGRFRYAGPLGAKSWTKQIGDDQYFNMLVVWGHEHMTVRDLRIGETPLSEFKDVTHVFHNSTTGNDLKYFNKSYNEQSVGAALAHNAPVVREIGECDSISVDIYFPALADVTSGNTASASVTFRIEYALSGTENWQAYAQSSRFFAPAQYRSSYPCGGFTNLYCSSDGMWHASPCGDKGDNRPGTMINVTDPHWNPFPIERYKDKHKKHEYWTRDTWYDAGVQPYVTISAGSTRPITRSFEWAVPHGKYKVRITRITEDKNMETVYDDATWSVARAIVNRPAFNTPVPICCSEIRIRANEQLSGYVSDFNALCTSYFPMYGKYDANGMLIKNHFGWRKEADENGMLVENGEIVEDTDIDYVYGETVNPADHIRYLLTSRHALNSPYTETKIDEAALSKFADYCIDSDYQFSLVCDSEAAAWNRLTSVAAAGRGAITTDNDGLFGVTVDNADKTMTQMFTPRNSWGFSIERAFYSIPHALRVSYYDETDDYKQKEGFIYADGYNKNNATDIVEWSMTGKTRWEDNYRMGRYYLASLKLRPITVTLSTDWEWMMCRRGDVVGVSHDVLLNTFGTARIVALIYKTEEGDIYYVHREEDVPSTDDALPIGVKLDDTVIFSEDYGAYGIAVRSKSGTVLTYEVQSTPGKETSDMMFSNPIVAAQMPYLGALTSVSVLGKETAKYLVAAISVSDHNSAELTLVPWAMPEVLNSENGIIPPWEPPIYLTTIGSKGSLPAPSIRDIKSDESMLKRSGNSLIVCMGVWHELPSGIDSRHGRIFVQGKIAIKSNPEDTIATNMVDSTALNYIEFTDVTENETYIVKIRLIGDDSGVVSDWSEEKVHKVVGRTTIPEPPSGVNLKINPSEGIEVSWEAVDSLDISHYEVNSVSTDSLKTINLYALLPVYNQIGEIPISVQAVDVLGLKSEATVALIEVLAPSTPNPLYTVEANRGTEVSWKTCKTTWNIDYYEVEDLWSSTRMVYTDSRFSISPRPLASSYRFLLTAVDIFGNRSAVKDFYLTVGAMPAPAPAVKLDGTQVVVSWEAVAAPFALEWYEVQTQEGALVGKVKGTELRFEAPKSGTHGWKVRGIDIAENIGPWGECSIVLSAPKAPVVSVKLSDDRTLIDISWTAPTAELPLRGYDVVRQWTETRPDGVIETHEEDYGRYDSLALSVLPVMAGTHSFMVRAVDSAGNTSNWGSADFVVHAPGKVTFFDCSPVDNNVMIYYTDPDSIFFRIREYLVEEVQDGFGAEVGRTDTHFFAEVRPKGGVYGYGVTPIDVAGNLGTRNVINITVGDPPDYLIFTEEESLFNGQRVNMVLDGKGNMIGPVPDGETWTENAERAAALIDGTADSVTWQGKADAGYEHWLSPAVVRGEYVEVIDAGTLIPSTKISVDVTQDTLKGNPVMTCRIEVSEDGDAWREVTADGQVVLASLFRFVRFSFRWTGGMVAVSRIFYNLNVKRKTDFGRVECRADDVDGTEIFFNVNFTEVQSLPRPNVVNDTSEGGLTAYTDFDGGLNPKSFRCFVKNNKGQRVSATVDWLAGGV